MQRGFAASVREAQALLLGGKVQVKGVPDAKPGAQVAEDVPISVEEKELFASRGGLKLAAALQKFPVSVRGKVCADVGCSTGGFTDVLLQAGAGRVYAIDVGYGDLAWHLRSDPRVTVMERTNACYLNSLAEPVNCIVIDVSLLSLMKVLPTVRQWLSADGDIIALVKPQYEATPEELPEGAVIESEDTHRKILNRLLEWCCAAELSPQGLCAAPVRGMGGNQEFLLWLRPTQILLHPIPELVEGALRGST